MEVIPSDSIQFSSVQVDVQYEQIVRIRNLSGKSARLRIHRQPKFSYFTLSLRSLESIAPNLYADILVSFRFKDTDIMPSVLDDSFELKLENIPSPVTLKLQARRSSSP
jgi:hypothetical protein